MRQMYLLQRSSGVVLFLSPTHHGRSLSSTLVTFLLTARTSLSGASLFVVRCCVDSFGFSSRLVGFNSVWLVFFFSMSSSVQCVSILFTLFSCCYRRCFKLSVGEMGKTMAHSMDPQPSRPFAIFSHAYIEHWVWVLECQNFPGVPPMNSGQHHRPLPSLAM